VEWQNKGYLKKLINKWYLFSEVEITENLLYRVSNSLLRPSYISLESALAYYHLIPEAVYAHQAISTRKTTRYETPIGVFQYRHIPPSCYFGYKILRSDGFPVLMAEFEKALLDYFYLNSSLKTKKDLEAVRFNKAELQNHLNWDKLLQYATVFNSTTLNRRINLFKNIFDASSDGN